jgi:methylthioribulose-1-phosphate dehydratase
MQRDDSKAIASRLVEVGRRFYARGWVLGTSGNFSVVESRTPLRLAITASAAHKGQLRSSDILLCDESGVPIRRAAAKRARARGGEGDGLRRPSAETALHLEIVKRRGAGAVRHTHSVWTTVLSDRHGEAGGFAIQGYEMLKGLTGIASHEHREWLPIVENDQDMPRLAALVGQLLDERPDTHAFLLRRHGLYTWGATLADAERQIEILEFLFETVGLTLQLNQIERS